MSFLCRICLGDEALIPLFDHKNEEYKNTLLKLNICFGDVPDIPGYPRNICDNCYVLLEETVSFITKFKESCKLLEERIKKEPNNDLLDHYSEPEIEIDFDHVSNIIPKAEFENIQYDIPEILVQNSETIETENTSKLENNKPHWRKKKKYTDNTIACSLLEGEFVFHGENWSLKNADKLIGKILKPAKEKKNKTIVKKIKKSPEKKTRKKKRPSSQRAPILCDECGKSFTDNMKYSRHKSSHLVEKPHKCTECPKKFNSLANMKQHLQRVHNKKKHICSDCGKVFLSRDSFVSHYKYKHKKVKRQYKGHTCKLCGKVNITIKTALIHERSVHTGERPAICTVCDARFFHDDYLKEHMRLHTGETPYKCPVCDKGFAQRGNMKSHIKHNHSISQLSEQIRNQIDKKYFKYMKP